MCIAPGSSRWEQIEERNERPRMGWNVVPVEYNQQMLLQKKRQSLVPKKLQPLLKKGEGTGFVNFTA